MIELKPPKEFFIEQRSQRENIESENAAIALAEGCEYGEGIGIKIHYKGAQFPQKGLTFPEAIQAINTAKRVFIEFFKLRPIVFSLEKCVRAYNSVCYSSIYPIRYRYELRTPVSLAVKDFVFKFLSFLQVNREECEKASEIFSAIFEFDDAYRYRLQDIMSETNYERLSVNARAEINRLFKIFSERDHVNMANKFRSFARIAALALIIPSVKKAFLFAITGNIINLQYDDEDRYWVMMRDGYKFMGKTYPERQQMMVDKGWKRAETFTRNGTNS